MYVVPAFFDAELCARLLSELRSVNGIPATVRQKGADYIVDESVRRTKMADVSEHTVSLVETRLLAIKPELESHFNVRTTGCRRPSFLVYREGDFFGPHADSSSAPDAPETATGRQVSIVVFLNGESEKRAPDSYGGGSLTFFGLWDDLAMKKYGFPLTAEPGLLVAFRPEVVHSVSPVSHGERYTIVSWLHA